MIRFCDKEVVCVGEVQDRQELIAYFLNGHRNEIVCVLDDQGKYKGKITYDSLLGKDLEDSISKEYLILDENIWENGKKCFSSYQKGFGGLELLPVLNKERHLLCFAWQDDEANRELRMLDELMESSAAFGFQELFPKYDGVVIDGCNELAFHFARYLQKQRVPFYVLGELWKSIGLGEIAKRKLDEETLDYRRFIVYSEGLESKAKKIEKRRSVSAEFECIDLIYEENIRRGIIEDTVGNFQKMLKKVSEKQVALIGTGEDALNAYNLLLKYKIDICCFISEKEGYQSKKLFGKSVLSRLEAEMVFGNIVFINPSFQYSAWGFGDVDFYHYLGYKRNVSFFLLKDYIDIPKEGLLNVLSNFINISEEKLVLVGDFWLCLRLRNELETICGDVNEKIVYCDVLLEYVEEKDIPVINVQELNENDYCLLVLSKCNGCFSINNGHILTRDQKITNRYLLELKKYGVNNVAKYLLENFVNTDKNTHRQNSNKSKYVVKEIILGSIEPYSGNIFFRGLLDAHPQILMLNYGYLNENLFSVCIRLSMEKGERIPELFWKLCGEHCLWKDEQKVKFNHFMQSMLKEKRYYTSQELFVIIHISYAKMNGRNADDVFNHVIYWEPHNIPRAMLEDYAEWLKEICDTGRIVNVVRNMYIKDGSYLKDVEKVQQRLAHSGKDIFRDMLFYRYMDKEYNGWIRVVFKFEDLKCHPRKELERLCDELGIVWSDTLLETTENSEKSYYGDITGFDTSPVYRTYDEYFSAFDRFRISLITGIWQKKYGYSYVSSLAFSRREICEMVEKKFRFEAKLKFSDEEEEMEFQRWKHKIISDYLWMERRVEICVLPL